MVDAPLRLPDWEAFYRDYRKPGYVPGFEITTKLGGGMSGQVFRARRMSIGKDYAIKFLQVDDAEVRKAVVSELEQVRWFAQIDHPNLVSIEDRGEVDGIPYLVMAFAGTETLRDKLTGAPPSGEAKDELVRAFLQCCRGLAALHERSLVHFDIKPANVFLKGGVARLGDYGLSKLVTHSRGSLSMGRGTPYYMAPEMLQRRGDHRSDVYSAGVMLYEILTGTVPFTGDSEWEVLKKHESEPPAMPSHLSPREIAILQRCLQKDPAARFQSVHDLIAAFGAPAGVGAAAWSDVRAGGGAPTRVVPTPSPPAAGSSPPPIPGSTEEAVAGFGRASREAMKHASTLAQRAAHEAGKLAQQAVAGAQRLVRDAVDKSRTYRVRRYRALQQLKRQRHEDTREQALELAEAIGQGPPKPRRGWRIGWFAFPATVVLLIAALAAVFWAGAPSPVPYAATTGYASPGDRQPTFRSILVPFPFDGAVSHAEPHWVATAQQDLSEARAELLAHIDRLRAKAPLDERARAQAVSLPEFKPAPGQAAVRAELDERVSRFLAARDYDAYVAGGLVAAAPDSLVVLAERLARIDWQRRGAFLTAVRLQRVLEEATGCRDLPVYGDEDTPAEHLAEANRSLGVLWLWFVNEFAHTPRTWTTYCQLMRDR
jgi:hypothetical protein